MSVDKWIWQGHAGHFCCANRCLFRLNTVINKKFIVSTVGELFLDFNDLSPEKMEDIGCNRKYETMVFETSSKSKCTCGCGEYIMKSGLEIDFLSAQDAITAHKNHMKLCKKWDKNED